RQQFCTCCKSRSAAPTSPLPGMRELPFCFSLQCLDGCKCGPIDVLFVLDSSESIGLQNFQIAKDFIIKVIDRLSKDERVKVSFQGDILEAQFLQNYTVIAKVIDDMEFINDATDVNAALRYVTNLYQQSSRANANKRVLIFSDGNSQGITRNDIERAVQEAQQAGITIYVLAVGSQPHESNLQALVTGKTTEHKVAYEENHLFRMPDYNSLLQGVFYQKVSRRIAAEN
uniref:VWFA domain-containing protein n=1 Tax=Gopherus evgoodei TaxID=1825980 RepID=A0A8C4Y0T3_9SAUR